LLKGVKQAGQHQGDGLGRSTPETTYENDVDIELNGRELGLYAWIELGLVVSSACRAHYFYFLFKEEGHVRVKEMALFPY
jgi:hypothetical protein